MTYPTGASALMPPDAADPQPRRIHALILLATSSLSVLVTAVLGPSLPLMQAQFANVPGANYLVPLVVTSPMLVMALMCIWIGMWSDRVGRKRLLIGATALYAVVGCAPLFIDSLGVILATRIALGVTEATLMTVSTAMIGDYYSGRQRERYMALVITLSATSAFVFNNLGGALAQFGWRAPYAVYAISLPLALLMAIYLFEPKKSARPLTSQGLESRPAADEPAFRPSLLALICLVSVLVGLVFLIVPIHFGYLFQAIGIGPSAQVGMAYGLNSLALIVGTLIFGWVLVQHLNVALQLGLGAAVAAIGFVWMRSADTATALTAAGIVNGLGCGILLPTVVTWSMRTLPAAKRATGTGATQSAQFFGMFVNPVVVVGLQDVLQQPRAHAIGMVGMVLMALAALALLLGFWRRFGQSNPALA